MRISRIMWVTAPTRIEVLGIKASTAQPRDNATPMPSERRKSTPAEITKSVDSLRVVLETESRQFNTISNASKSRHDITMNAIHNMKG